MAGKPRKKHCIICDELLFNRASNAKYCKPCAKIVRDKQQKLLS